MRVDRLEKQASLRQIDNDLTWLESRYHRTDLSGWSEALVYDSGGDGEALIFAPVLAPFDVIHVPNIKHFADRCRVVTYRRRELLDRPLYPADRAEEIGQLMDHLEIEAAHFCGLNEGAIAVFALAKTAPERVRSIVCTCIGEDVLVSGFHRWLASHFPFTPSARLVGQVISLLMLRAASDNFVVAYLWSMNPHPLATLVNGVLPLYERYPPPVEPLTMPVLNIQSSPIVSLGSAQRFVSKLPQGELKILPGNAHLGMWTYAADFNRLMEEFYEQRRLLVKS